MDGRAKPAAAALAAFKERNPKPKPPKEIKGAAANRVRSVEDSWLVVKWQGQYEPLKAAADEEAAARKREQQQAIGYAAQHKEQRAAPAAAAACDSVVATSVTAATVELSAVENSAFEHSASNADPGDLEFHGTVDSDEFTPGDTSQTPAHQSPPPL